MKHKTAELEGALLDAAVAMAVGYLFQVKEVMSSDYRSRFPACLIAEHGQQWSKRTTDYRFWMPSKKWEDAGPIIERERIAVDPLADPSSLMAWRAIVESIERHPWNFGPTALVAAMRAFVASKFGAEVDLP